MKELLPCGTFAAYKRHWKAKERACQACVDANRAHSADYYARNREKKLAKMRVPPRPFEWKVCASPDCTQPFETDHPARLYCSKKCRTRASKIRYNASVKNRAPYEWRRYPCTLFFPDGTRRASRVTVKWSHEPGALEPALLPYCSPCNVQIGYEPRPGTDELWVWCWKCGVRLVMADDPV